MLKGTIHTDESKKKIAYWVSGKRNGMYGKHHSDETKRKISKSLTNKIRNTKRKTVICIENNEIFNSISEAARKYNLVVSHISGCCKGNRKTAGGYHWKYANE